jgi:hypothetical protein
MSLTFQVTPQNPNIAPNQEMTFQAIFSAAPYTYSVLIGGAGGTIDPDSGVYTAPAGIDTGGDVIVATDINGDTAQTQVNIVNPPMQSQGDVTCLIDGAFTAQISGGTTPYVFEVLAGGAGGTIDPASGVYDAPDDGGIDTIQVTDAFGQEIEFDVLVQPAQLQLYPPYLAISQYNQAPFQGAGGTPIVSDDPDYTSEYRYSIQSGPGYIDEYTGIFKTEQFTGITIVQVTDGNGCTATATVLVGSYLQLFCDVLQQELFPNTTQRVWFWDQKVDEPTDDGMFIVCRVLNPKVFGNTNKVCSGDIGAQQVQSAYMNVQLQIDVKSRSTEALDRLEEIVQALNSIYSQQQQEANAFKIFPVTNNIVDMSGLDGAAIPYRFVLSVKIQYTKTTIKRAAPYYDTFSTASVTTQP